MKTTAQKIRYNITRTINRATPQNIEAGLSWYAKARANAREIAEENGRTLEEIADVISILSPFNRWHSNLDQASALTFAHTFAPDEDKLAEAVSKIPFTTFENNVVKALARLEGAKVLTPQSPKTYNFAQNIRGNLELVTIDRWMLRAINYPASQLTPKEYKEIEAIFQDYARTRTDYKPAQLQAIIWETVRV